MFSSQIDMKQAAGDLFINKPNLLANRNARWDSIQATDFHTTFQAVHASPDRTNGTDFSQDLQQKHTSKPKKSLKTTFKVWLLLTQKRVRHVAPQ